MNLSYYFLMLFFEMCIALSPNNKQTVKYEVKPPGFIEETKTIEGNVINNADKTFSIQVIEDISILKKGLLDITAETYYFWMDYHKLKAIEPGAFDNQNITEAIRLEGNNLTKLERGTFVGLAVKRIFLDYNQITSIEPGALKDLPNLQEFSVSRNLLAQFYENSVINTPNLQILVLSFNKLKALTPRMFSFMKKHEPVMLGLGPNDIEILDPLAFEEIKISNLNLTYNNLKEIPDEIFVKNELLYLDLENNLLHTLPNSFFTQNKLLDAVLNGNHFNCSIVDKLVKFNGELGPLHGPWGRGERQRIKFDRKNCQ